MIKLFSLKQQKQEAEAAGQASGSRTSAAQLRATKDHNELQVPSSCKLEFDDPDDLMNFRLILRPTEGFYRGGRFQFTFNVGRNYPHEPPKVHCDTKIYHPNIDLEGAICLNILREDWKPVLNLQSVIYGLMFLFLEPNDSDPLNKDAAQVMHSDRSQFERNVRRAMQGGSIGGETFEYCMDK
ncbi:uncharacterized protein MONBRDRAFT_35275 [Monosiga brevicollis MX1]|uniref:UBC core domain-containing protein n=1 Tax=Monosiga brevicollis TaxID=81824 RepID=A9V8M4_MONBE|nr:uncharacterized protein MONBRDRAFT_35275 [Monosiga brevicollis MX1]EDQ86109.1 predicted protein [Monosiga brevicollis MX1]|eukprot:XP_001749034.1 hypothetical protein [Monosiga brevicollis MX1]